MMNSWYSVEFIVNWGGQYRLTPDSGSVPTTFFIDLIIIDLLISSAVEKYRSKIEAWRIHRRADNTDGQILTLYFYTEAGTANDIFQEIESNTCLNFIKDNYLKNSIRLGGGTPGEIDKGASDSHWPDEIRKTWPYYMSGVCDMFIKLICEVKKSKSEVVDKDSSRDKIENYYREVEKEITSKWARYGQHAFFHHLEAVFGYEPTLFGGQSWFRAGRATFPEKQP